MCTTTKPRVVVWHFTPRSTPDEILRASHWRELERGAHPVGRLPSTAARLLETALANAIEARLLSQKSYILLPPSALVPSSSLPLLRAGPSSLGGALRGTLGVEVAAFIQGDQLGIIAQVKRFPLVAVRGADLRKVRGEACEGSLWTLSLGKTFRLFIAAIYIPLITGSGVQHSIGWKKSRGGGAARRCCGHPWRSAAMAANPRGVVSAC